MQRTAPLILVLILAAIVGFLVLKPHAPQEKPLAQHTVKTDVSVATAKPRPWPQAASDIPADTGAIFGSLENGMRYIIYPNAEPPRRVSLRLHIAAGSLMEADDQQGLAHFLEHMVFNGTKHYTADDLVPKMQRLGIAFGAHLNAYTSFDETVYQLDLPNLSEDTLKLGFTVMRDFGDGALLAAEEIDKERGVVVSEMVSRDSVDYRMTQQQFKALLPDALVPKRFPIGLEDVLQNAPRERFVDLYTRYYTPSRMTFVAVGDIKPEDIITRIKATFGTMQNPQSPGTDPDLGSIAPLAGNEFHLFTDKEVTSTDLSIVTVKPYTPEPDTSATRAANLRLAVANAMLSRRFDRLAKLEDSPITEGDAYDYTLFNFARIGGISVTAANDDWQAALPLLEHEFRRAIEHGFNDSEFAEAKSNVLNAMEQAVKSKASRKSDAIASSLASSTHEEKVFSTPETNLQLARTALDGMDADACSAAFTEFWANSGNHIILTTKEASDDTKAALAALYAESAKAPVEPLAKLETAPFAYTDFGKPGTVALRTEVEDLGITQLTLSNHIRINLKPTDFEKGRIRLLAEIGSGQLSQPAGKPMLDNFATAILEGGGLGKHSNDELQQILAGKTVSSAFAIGEDTFTLSGATTGDDFLLECQLLCASITDPGYRQEALWQFQKSIPVLDQQLKHTPAGPQAHMNAWLHNDDARYSIATPAQLSQYAIDDAKTWLTPELNQGYLELSIVGDFSVDAVLPHLLATFGALPARAATPAALDEAREMPFPAAPQSKSFTYETKIPQAIAMQLWQTPGLRHNIEQFRRLNILSSILTDRLRTKIREELGASYGPAAFANGSEALDNFGFIAAQCVGKPEDLEKLQTTTLQLAATLAQDGATQDELDRALTPVLSMLEKTLRDNSYWLDTVLSRSQADPTRLTYCRQRDADYRSINLAEINALAKQHLNPNQALTIAIEPEK